MANVNAIPPKNTAPKGGARFPRYGLKECLAWSSKLVSKTHTGAQPADLVYASVVNAKGSTGDMKVSALKQFGLLKGSSKAYSSTDLGRAIAAAPEEDLEPLRARAALSPVVFKGLFETFHGDEVTLGRLRQRAAELNVHPENTTACVNNYVASLVVAGLVTLDGEKVAHRPAVQEGASLTPLQDHDGIQAGLGREQIDDEAGENERDGSEDTDEEDASLHGSPRAVFHVNVNLDASLDTDKLERQLALLKRFGAI